MGDLPLSGLLPPMPSLPGMNSFSLAWFASRSISSSIRFLGLIALSSCWSAMKDMAGGRSLSVLPLIGGSSDWIRRSRYDSGCWGWTRIAMGSISV